MELEGQQNIIGNPDHPVITLSLNPETGPIVSDCIALD